MRIGVDGRALAGGLKSALRQPRGVARYVSSMLDALQARHEADEWLVAGPRPRLANASAALTGRPRLDSALGAEPDVVWLPAPAPVAVSPAVPYVLTVHDLSLQLRPGDYSAYARLWNRVAGTGRLARRAARVVTDSDQVRAQAVEHWGLAPGDVTVVRPGFWRPPTPPETPGLRMELPTRYLLFVGALEPRKGVDVLVAAFAAARARGLEAELVLAGDGPLAGSLDAPGVRLLGRVSDPELARLYAGARATVLPSWIEGFGFTPLESLAAGVPVVVSDLPSLRETLGPAAVTVPPGDSEALAAALLRIDRDEQLRARLLDAAPPQVGRLSWERAADEIHAVLAEVAGG